MYNDLIKISSFSIQIKLLLRGSGLTSSKKLSVIICLLLSVMAKMGPLGRFCTWEDCIAGSHSRAAEASSFYL